MISARVSFLLLPCFIPALASFLQEKAWQRDDHSVNEEGKTSNDFVRNCHKKPKEAKLLWIYDFALLYMLILEFVEHPNLKHSSRKMCC